jgi:hypothetical protein
MKTTIQNQNPPYNMPDIPSSNVQMTDIGDIISC